MKSTLCSARGCGILVLVRFEGVESVCVRSCTLDASTLNTWQALKKVNAAQPPPPKRAWMVVSIV